MEYSIDMTDIKQRDHFILCNFIARMRIETKTSMVHSGGSTIAKAKLHDNVQGEQPRISGRTKAAVLCQLEALYAERSGRDYGRVAS